jgi:putative flippase GtrA
MFRNLFVNKSDRTAVHLIRSVFSSNVAFAVDFGILVVLTEVVGLHYLISNGIAFMVGTTISYTLSVFWVFSRRSIANKHAEYWIFILIGVVGVGLNEALIWTFTEHVHIHYLISKVIAGSSVFFFNFFARKYVLFR